VTAACHLNEHLIHPRHPLPGVAAMEMVMVWWRCRFTTRTELLVLGLVHPQDDDDAAASDDDDDDGDGKEGK
jgi:hypothetical protein